MRARIGGWIELTSFARITLAAESETKLRFAPSTGKEPVAPGKDIEQEETEGTEK